MDDDDKQEVPGDTVAVDRRSRERWRSAKRYLDVIFKWTHLMGLVSPRYV